jgi:hypothetical protein
MTKLEFAELLRLSMGVDAQDKRASFDDRVIWRLGDVVRGELIDAYAKDSESKGEFVRGLVIDVQNDSVRNRRYVEITGNVLNLPNNGGFVSMSLTQGDETPFTISNAGQVGIASGLECENVGGPVGWQEGGRVYFKDLDPIVEKVLVIGIPSIAALDDNEAIPVPFGMESIWFDKTKAKYGPVQPEDNQPSDTKAPKE